MSRVKGLDRDGNEGGAGALESGEAKPPRSRLQVRGEVSLGMLDAPQDRVGVTQQELAGLGEPRDNLVVRVAAPDEDEAVSALATRAGAARPAGALMVAAIDGRLLAAVSMRNGETVREPTPLGIAAAAVVRYRVARLAGPRGTSQKAAIAA